MQLSITTRHCKAGGDIKEYAVEKAAKLRKYFPHLVSARIIMTQEAYRHTAEITLSARHMSLVGKETSSDMHSAVDLALANVQKQLRRFRDKVKEHKARRRSARR